MPLRVLLVDDEELALDELRFILGKIDGVRVVGTAESGHRALELCEKLEPDVVFLDIKLGDMTGVEVAQKLAASGKSPHIVFATAYDQFATKAFELDARDYVLKPFEEERLRKTVGRLKAMLGRHAGGEEPRHARRSEHVRIAAGDKSWDSARDESRDAASSIRPLANMITVEVDPGPRLILVDVSEIIFIEAQGRRSTIQTTGGAIRCNHLLKDLEGRITSCFFKHFFKPHRSYLVNLTQIKEIIPWFNGTYLLKMADPEVTEIPVTRGNVADFRRLLGL